MIFAFCQYFTWIISNLIGRIFLGMKVEGLRNLRSLSKGGVVFVANHGGYLDPFLIGAALPRSHYKNIKCFRYATYYKYVSAKLYGPLIWLSGAYPIYPKIGKIEVVLKSTLGYLKDNQNVLVFPTGIRSQYCTPSMARPGISYIAKELNPIIVPTNICDTFQPRIGEIFKRTRKVKIIFGKPFKYTDIADKNEGSGSLAVKIMAQICELDQKCTIEAYSKK